MIFVSHNNTDKDIVEPIALRLKDTFGQDKVFYDSWSIQPGDGIVDKMNEALGECKIFLLFVSNNSLKSEMVNLEWQNALMQTASKELKIIPVKLDSCNMPPVLMQNLYINLFEQGLEVAYRQIVDVVEGKNTFRCERQNFSNLRAYIKVIDDKKTIIECRAEHYLEPITRFLFLVDNEESELSFKHQEGMCFSGFHQNITLNDGRRHNAKYMRVERATALYFPFVVEVITNKNAELNLRGVMHQTREDRYEMIPLIHEQVVGHIQNKQS